ncbi:hypothetical protein K435DRAFT_806531 [Dendrothele bispora CBS 962.96]|uniref:Uncharacterized protein n=1 Tax=Dendrothele bispora (strain CBS 962.96) TaxID=1314807 RepID=A0A4S8L7Z5_DENBC|nr:hypothetical protein K435DRAFT_806531 [Dendrothele bispora CBS 962.96]
MLGPARRTETRVASESESDVGQLLSDDLEGISHWFTLVDTCIFSGPVEGTLIIISYGYIRPLILEHTGPSAAPPLFLPYSSCFKVAPYANMGINEAFVVFVGFGLALTFIVSCSNIHAAMHSESKLSLPSS